MASWVTLLDHGVSNVVQHLFLSWSIFLDVVEEEVESLDWQPDDRKVCALVDSNVKHSWVVRLFAMVVDRLDVRGQDHVLVGHEL